MVSASMCSHPGSHGLCSLQLPPLNATLIRGHRVCHRRGLIGSKIQQPLLQCGTNPRPGSSHHSHTQSRSNREFWVLIPHATDRLGANPGLALSCSYSLSLLKYYDVTFLFVKYSFLRWIMGTQVFITVSFRFLTAWNMSHGQKKETCSLCTLTVVSSYWWGSPRTPTRWRDKVPRDECFITSGVERWVHFN